MHLLPFLKRFYLFIFREIGREGKREGEKHQCVGASHMPPTRDQARNPGVCPDQDLNWWPFGLQDSTQPTEPHQPGIYCHFTVRSFDLFFLEDHYFIFIYFFINYLIFVQLQLSAFSPHPSTPPQPNLPPFPASTLPLGFVHVSFIVVPENPSPHCPFPPPLWLLHCS